MEEFGTEPIEDLKIINGIAFPRWLDKRKLIITGPPGTGKTTILNSIGGWPEEGYLDISTRDWWKSPALAYRPREMHFGLPFVGFENAVPVYDTDSLDDSSFLEKVASHLEAAIESIFLRQEMMDFSELLTHKARYSEWTRYLLWTLSSVIWVQAVVIVYFWSAGKP